MAGIAIDRFAQKRARVQNKALELSTNKKVLGTAAAPAVRAPRAPLAADSRTVAWVGITDESLATVTWAVIHTWLRLLWYGTVDWISKPWLLVKSASRSAIGLL